MDCSTLPGVGVGGQRRGQAWLRLETRAGHVPAPAKGGLWDTDDTRAQMPKKPFPCFQAIWQVGGGGEEDCGCLWSLERGAGVCAGMVSVAIHEPQRRGAWTDILTGA